MKAGRSEESTMPKKDTASAVLGMLSTAGAQTRAPMPEPRPAEPADPEPTASTGSTPTAPAQRATAVEPAAGSVSTLPTARQSSRVAAEESAPRTLRLRPDTAAELRAAWLQAKR